VESLTNVPGSAQIDRAELSIHLKDEVIQVTCPAVTY